MAALKHKVNLEYPDSNGQSRSRVLNNAIKAYKKRGRDTCEIEEELKGPEIPNAAYELWQTFWDIRSGVKTDEPLNNTEFLSYMTLFDVELSYIERRLIKDLDSAFQSEISEKRIQEQNKQPKAQNKKW